MNPARVFREWQRNYRVRGGSPALVAGLVGSAALKLRSLQPQGTRDTGIEWITCSVVPGLTELWARVLLAALSSDETPLDSTIWVADCSGDLHLPSDARLRKVAVYNHVHGVKLDLFLRGKCTSPWVVVCDDDVFWTRTRPLRWALEEFSRRPKLAAVSLRPRPAPKSILAGAVEQPMGSFCLVLRRQTWIDEGLSFRTVDPSGEGRYEWTYDTADHAHVQMLERGYEVAIAPEEIQSDLASFDGVSTWTLKLQKHHGEMSSLLRTDLRLRKAYRVFRCLDVLSRDYGQPRLAEGPLLDRALAWCREHLSEDDQAAVELDLKTTLTAIEIRNHVG